mgnify:CR=1 FL=1
MEDVRHYGFEVRRLDHVFARNLEAKVREKGIDELTLMHGWIIRYLIENQDKDIYQKDIEKHCSIGRSTVTNILQLMEKNGFIYRESVEKDARLKRIVPTKKAEALRPSILYHINESEAQMTQGISKKDVAVCKQVLLQMLQNLSENKL